MSFPGGSVVENSPANAGDSRDAGLISRSGRSLGVGKGNPLQYSCLENLMDRGVWQAKSMGSPRVGYNCMCTTTHTHTHTQRQIYFRQTLFFN